MPSTLNCDEVLHLLRIHQQDLARFQVKSLALFGSRARNASSRLSDAARRGHAAIRPFYSEIRRGVDIVVKDHYVSWNSGI